MESSPLSQLPPDVLNRIYRLVLESDGNLLVIPETPIPHTAPFSKYKIESVAPLTRVCWDIREECLRMAYYIEDSTIITSKPSHAIDFINDTFPKLGAGFRMFIIELPTPIRIPSRGTCKQFLIIAQMYKSLKAYLTNNGSTNNIDVSLRLHFLEAEDTDKERRNIIDLRIDCFAADTKEYIRDISDALADSEYIDEEEDHDDAVYLVNIADFLTIALRLVEQHDGYLCGYEMHDVETASWQEYLEWSRLHFFDHR